MQPVMCQVSHDPQNGKYGDCLRACFATVLNMQADDVPHFFFDDCDNETGKKRIDDFLTPLGLTIATFAFGREHSLKDVLVSMNYSMPNGHYILLCQSGGANHAVVCQANKIVHNPAWYRQEITGPTDSGYWLVNVLVKL